MLKLIKGALMNQFQIDFLNQIKYLTNNDLNKLVQNPNDCYDLLRFEDAEYLEWLGSHNTLKTYTLIKERKGKETEITGNLYELMKYFGYTIENAHLASIKVNLMPKTIKSCISTIKKALDYKEGSCYERTRITLANDKK